MLCLAETICSLLWFRLVQMSEQVICSDIEQMWQQLLFTSKQKNCEHTHSALSVPHSLSHKILMQQAASSNRDKNFLAYLQLKPDMNYPEKHITMFFSLPGTKSDQRLSVLGQLGACLFYDYFPNARQMTILKVFYYSFYVLKIPKIRNLSVVFGIVF